MSAKPTEEAIKHNVFYRISFIQLFLFERNEGVIKSFAFYRMILFNFFFLKEKVAKRSKNLAGLSLSKMGAVRCPLPHIFHSLRLAKNARNPIVLTHLLPFLICADFLQSEIQIQ